MRHINHKRKFTGKGSNIADKKYSNPFFKTKTRKVNVNISSSGNIKIVFVVVFLLIFSAFWALFFSNYFDIKSINIEGGGKISVDDIRKYADNHKKSKRFIFFSQKNIFLFNKGSFRKFLESKHSFEYLEINKNFPASLSIKFNEKPYAVTWMENDKYFYADTEGGIITEANLLEVSEKQYPLIQNLSNQTIEGSQVKVDIKLIEYSIQLFSSFASYENEIVLEKFIIDNEKDTLKAKITGGPQIYFSTNLAIEKQIKKLLAVKKEKIKDNFNNLEYINLKIGDSVYYK